MKGERKLGVVRAGGRETSYFLLILFYFPIFFPEQITFAVHPVWVEIQIEHKHSLLQGVQEILSFFPTKKVSILLSRNKH